MFLTDSYFGSEIIFTKVSKYFMYESRKTIGLKSTVVKKSLNINKLSSQLIEPSKKVGTDWKLLHGQVLLFVKVNIIILILMISSSNSALVKKKNSPMHLISDSK